MAEEDRSNIIEVAMSETLYTLQCLNVFKICNKLKLSLCLAESDKLLYLIMLKLVRLTLNPK